MQSQRRFPPRSDLAAAAAEPGSVRLMPLPGGRAGVQPGQAQPGIGFPGIGQLIRRYALMILAIAVLGLTITYLSVRAQEPRFETVARIVLDPVATQLDPGAAEVHRTTVSDAEVATELDVMRSRDFLLKVAEALRLFEDPDFNPDWQPPPADADPAADAPADPAAGPPADPPPPPSAEAEEAVVTKLLSTFWLNSTPGSLTIDIHVADTRAERAAAIANALAQTFIAQSLDVQQGGLRQMVEFLEERLTGLRTNLAEAELESATWIRFNELDNPDVRLGLLTDLERVTAQIAIAGDDAEVQAGLQAERARIDAALRDRSQAELRRVRMDRYLETLRTREGLFANRYDALLAQLSILAPSARQVSYAHVPLSPSAPNLNTAMAGALVGSLAIGFVAAMFRASIDDRAWAGRPVAEAAGLVPLGRLPRIGRRQAARPGAGAAGVPLALREAARPILTQIRLQVERQGGRQTPLVLLVGSTRRGEGRTTLALALAAAAAAEGERALVIDLDSPGHGAADMLGLSRSAVAFATGPAEAARLMREIRHHAAPGGLSLLAPAAGRALPRQLFAPRAGAEGGAAALAEAGNPAGLFDLLRAETDLIVIDAPPALEGDACLRLAGLADAVVLACRTAGTPTARLREAAALLRRNGSDPCGVVENHG
ncbi:GumC domain-containing protein [Frigidibacter oleivorans]|uniref:hypothetical protein n=1 Tax=Frigidibacter oleivorans TaxID=2487129 RepID=UPI000F8DC282|nr:hypothetical protein [Frigidibacter oleivorans]